VALLGLWARLWRVDCVTKRLCDELTHDELTMWRRDRVTRWPCDELTGAVESLSFRNTVKNVPGPYHWDQTGFIWLLFNTGDLPSDRTAVTSVGVYRMAGATAGGVCCAAARCGAVERNYLSTFPGTLMLPQVCTAPQNMECRSHQSRSMLTNLLTDLCIMLIRLRMSRNFSHWLAIQNTWRSNAAVQNWLNCYISTYSIRPQCICWRDDYGEHHGHFRVWSHRWSGRRGSSEILPG